MSWLAAGLLLAWAVPTGPPLDVDLVNQQTGVWCWAASTEMVMRYYERHGLYATPRSQCDLADDEYGSCNCPGCPRTEEPTYACTLRGAAPPLAANGFDCVQLRDRALNYCELAEEFHRSAVGRPVIFEWAYTSTSSHLMVALDVGENQGERTVLINDPAPFCDGSSYAVKYRYFVESLTSVGLYYRHGVDYYRLKPSSAQPSCVEQVVAASACPESSTPLRIIQNELDLDAVAIEASHFLGTLKPAWVEKMGLNVPPGETVSVAESMPLYVLRLDKNVPLGASFDSLLFPVGPAGQRDYLLRLGDADFGVLTAYRTPQGWEAATIGRRPSAIESFRVRHTIPDMQPDIPASATPDDFVAVQVPVFNATFLLYHKDGIKKLIPLHPDTRLPDNVCGVGVKRGRPIDADCLFGQLIGLARQHNGMPS